MGTRHVDELAGREPLRGRGSAAPAPLHRHTGTLMSTGGPYWVLPIIFLPLPVLSWLNEGFDPKQVLLYSIIAGFGLLSLAWVLAAKLQAVELYEGHLVHRKWGMQRAVPYAEVQRAYSELRSASQSYDASFPRQGMTLWTTPRTMHVELASGGEVELVEMTEHELLERRLNELAGGAAGQGAS